MRLRIITPSIVIVDEDAILSLKAEDSSGSFGILPHHADFITSLSVSVMSWKSNDQKQHYCAVRGGALSVLAGQGVVVTTREAVPSDNMAKLEETVLSKFRSDIELEREEHSESARLQINAIRRIMNHLQTNRSSTAGTFS